MVRSWSVGVSVGGVVLTAALLAGCGTEGDNAAASPSGAGTSSASAATSPTTTPSPGATPADYVPASLDGPAENVPKPVMPELAKEESRDGAQAFLDYWSDAMWYAYQTGDTSYARDIISPACDVCMDQLDLLEEIYDAGSWAIGGRESVVIRDKNMVRAEGGVYKPIVTGSTEGAQLVEGGQVTLEVPADDGLGDPHLLFMDFRDSRWIYITAADMPGASHESP